MPQAVVPLMATMCWRGGGTSISSPKIPSHQMFSLRSGAYLLKSQMSQSITLQPICSGWFFFFELWTVDKMTVGDKSNPRLQNITSKDIKEATSMFSTVFFFRCRIPSWDSPSVATGAVWQPCEKWVNPKAFFKPAMCNPVKSGSSFLSPTPPHPINWCDNRLMLRWKWPWSISKQIVMRPPSYPAAPKHIMETLQVWATWTP